MDLDDQPALASARASGGGGATPRVAQQRPASAPPPLSATPVGGDEWAAVSVLDQNELLELLLAKGVQVPSSVLGVVCSRIEALSSVKAPAVLRQKRVYMQDWVHRQHAQAAALGVPLGLGEYPTPRPPTAAPVLTTPHSSLRSSGVGVGGGADGLSEHELQLAARVGTMVTPSGRLSIPSAEVPTLTAEVVAALGHSRHPISGSVSARRRFIEDWFDGLQPRLQGMQPPRGAAGADPLSPAPLPAFSPTSSAGGTPARHPAAAAAAEAAVAPGLATLYDALGAAAVQPQLLPAPALPPAELERAAAAICATTGAAPQGDSLPELQALVGDWYRWTVHLRHGAAAAAAAAAPAAPPPPAAALTAAASIPRLPPHFASPPPQTAPPSTRGMASGGGPSSMNLFLSAPMSPAAGGGAPTTPPSSGRRGLASGGGPSGGGPMSNGLPSARLRAGERDYEPPKDLSEDQILNELLGGGGGGGGELAASPSLTPTRLAAVAEQIELISGRRAPRLQQQRREYVSAWARNALARRSHAAALRDGGAEGGGCAPVPRLDRNITAPSIDTSKSASMLRALLAEYATPGGALDVPLEHLAIVAEQAEHLVNAKAPRPPQARRDWLAALWAKERAKELLR